MRLNGAQCSIPFLLDMTLDYFKKKMFDPWVQRFVQGQNMCLHVAAFI